MHVTAIIAAGGSGRRFGGAVPKQLVSIGGRSILERSVMLFATHPEIDEVIVALPQELVDDPPPYLKSLKSAVAQGKSGVAQGKSGVAQGFSPAGGRPDGLHSVRVRLVAGGPRRQDSVQHAFDAASPMAEMIVIHDAARPFATAGLVSRTIAAAMESGAAVAALAARDTVKWSKDDSDERPSTELPRPRIVHETLARESVFLAQTPQVFRREVLREALELATAGLDATDEATLAERAGYSVRLVEGEPTNLKITTPEDLVLAEAIAGHRPTLVPKDAGSGIVRIGTGYDLHRLVEGRPLIIGGVTIPSDKGALGHSDADVVCHAVTDAILGGANLGDIGRHFPDTDPRWKGASSLDLLARAVEIVREQGFVIANVDATVILERPKIKDHVDVMKVAVASAIGITAAEVSIKGKTNEGVDAVGRGEAIAAHAVALLRRV